MQNKKNKENTGKERYEKKRKIRKYILARGLYDSLFLYECMWVTQKMIASGMTLCINASRLLKI